MKRISKLIGVTVLAAGSALEPQKAAAQPPAGALESEQGQAGYDIRAIEKLGERMEDELDVLGKAGRTAMRNKFFQAVRGGGEHVENIERVIGSIVAGIVHVDEKGVGGNSALGIAVATRDITMATVLLDMGANVNQGMKLGGYRRDVPMVDVAMMQGDRAMAELLLSRGARASDDLVKRLEHIVSPPEPIVREGKKPKQPKIETFRPGSRIEYNLDGNKDMAQEFLDMIKKYKSGIALHMAPGHELEEQGNSMLARMAARGQAGRDRGKTGRG